ncbi:hypothetical protein PRZ48_008532 [Zasmidium cellare]|uniref:DUF4185 domain-containing protein n=1 Tax=Zasmidium cellare TaxID=395010 RepID=A0ABR0EGL0_ZASCE|nr:hypothetical protein PRZ48_008532 [Zasmidium cellare]
MNSLIALTAALVPLTQGVSVSSVQFLGNLVPSPDDNTVRDLGFVGSIGGKNILTFGDTNVCSNASTFTNCGVPVAANSAGRIQSPTTFRDTPDQNNPQMFCKYFSDEDPGNRITNIIATSGTDGVLYFLPILRNLNAPDSVYAIGAGVAHITFTVDGSGTPVWDGSKEPHYGDKSAFISNDLKYIYALGGCNATVAGGSYVFVSRVPLANATSLSAHQYWNGQAWTSTRINANSAAALKETSGSLITADNQGQIAWNKYLNKYIWLQQGVSIRTADNAQGPWTPAQSLFSTGSYAPCSGYTYSPTYDTLWYSGDQTFVTHVTCINGPIQSFKEPDVFAAFKTTMYVVRSKVLMRFLQKS